MWEEAEYEKEFSTRKEWINRIDLKFYEGLFCSYEQNNFFVCVGGGFDSVLFVKTETFTNLWKV